MTLEGSSRNSPCQVRGWRVFFGHKNTQNITYQDDPVSIDPYLSGDKNAELNVLNVKEGATFFFFLTRLTIQMGSPGLVPNDKD